MSGRTLTDLCLGLCMFLIAGMLFAVLRSESMVAPKVLAFSVHSCGAEGGDECTSGATKRELVDGEYRAFSCNLNCQWEMNTAAPAKDAIVLPYCCLSDGARAQCLPMPPLQSCEKTTTYLYAVRYESRNDCFGVRLDPTCGAVSSSRSSASDTRCGDGIVQKLNGDRETEQCDPKEKGKERSNTLPNRCRMNCQYPACGDSVLDDDYVDGTYKLQEQCENVNPVASPSDWEWNRHPSCNNDCTIKAEEEAPVYFMFKSIVENTLWFIRPLVDWQSVFLPFTETEF